MKPVKISFFVLLIALIIAGASAAGSNSAGVKPEVRGYSIQPIDGIPFDTWTFFSWNGAGEPKAADQTFSYTSEVPTRVRVVDLALPGDQFKIYLNGASLGVTSLVPPVENPPYWTADPDTAWGMSEYSKGCFDVNPSPTGGLNVITIDVVKNPFGYGDARIRVEEGSCPTTPSPEFPTMLLPLTFIIGFVGVVFLIQRTKE